MLCLICNSMSRPMTWLYAGRTPEGKVMPDMADPSCGTEDAPFKAVLVFSDPIDWYRDLQLITDVIMSGRHGMSFCLSQPQTVICKSWYAHIQYCGCLVRHWHLDQLCRLECCSCYGLLFTFIFTVYELDCYRIFSQALLLASHDQLTRSAKSTLPEWGCCVYTGQD